MSRSIFSSPGDGRRVRTRAVSRLLCLLALLLVLAPPAAATPAPAASGNAGLVIDFGNGQVRAFCFAVPAAGVSGLDLLQRTGLAMRLDYVSLGAEICAINGVGCQDASQSCYCQCQGTPCIFWKYAEWRGDHWVSMNLGASSQVVRPGTIDGWSWGGTPPPPFGDALCAFTAAPTATPPLPTPRPAPTATRPPPRPTATPRPPTRPPAPRPVTPTPRPAATAPASATVPPPTATPIPSPLPPTSTSTTTPSAAPSATPLASIAAATAPPTAVSAPSPGATDTPNPTPQPPTPNPQPPASYWVLGLLALGLLGLIAWARLGRRGAGAGR